MAVTKSETELLVDTQPIDDFLVDANRRPVWPVRTDYDWQLLERYCSVLKVDIREVRGRRGRIRARRQEVWGLGEEVFDMARLYAHLTRRCFRVTPELGGLVLSSRVAVIVANASRIDADVLNALYARTVAAAPGIICDNFPQGIRTQVLLRSAAATLVGYAGPPINLGFLRADRQASDEDSDRPRGEPDEGYVRSAVSRGTEALAVTTHSDGTDAYLGPHLSMCAISDPPTEADPARTPYCWATSYCFRHEMAVSEALASNRILSPAVVKAKIMVWGACFGYPSPARSVDSKWALLWGLLHSGSVGCLITPWSVAMTSQAFIGALVRDLTAGTSAGVAVARHNRSRPARETGTQFCIIGDPDTRVAILDTSASPQKGGAATRPKVMGHADLRGTSFLLACLPLLFTECADVKARSLCREAELALRRYQRAGEIGMDVEGVPPALGPNARQSVAELFRYQGSLLVDFTPTWLSLARRSYSLPSTPCPSCLADRDVHCYEFFVPWIERRTVTKCARCGVQKDVPSGAMVDLSVRPGVAVLSGVPPGTDWLGRLVVSRGSRIVAEWTWPVGSHGRAKRLLRFSQPAKGAVLHARLVVLVGTTIAVVGSHFESGKNRRPMRASVTRPMSEPRRPQSKLA